MAKTVYRENNDRDFETLSGRDKACIVARRLVVAKMTHCVSRVGWYTPLTHPLTHKGVPWISERRPFIHSNLLPLFTFFHFFLGGGGVKISKIMIFTKN